MSYTFSHLKTRTPAIEEWLRHEFASIRTGRATPSLLDGVQVQSYGSSSPISHVASVSIEGPKTLRIVPWDKTQIKAIESALHASNLGVSVAVDDQGIRVNFPDLTAESRQKFVKIAKDLLEQAKITLRQEREKTWNDITEKEKEGAISEDEKFRAKDEMQKLVDECSGNLEALFERKEKEITEV